MSISNNLILQMSKNLNENVLSAIEKPPGFYEGNSKIIDDRWCHDVAIAA